MKTDQEIISFWGEHMDFTPIQLAAIDRMVNEARHLGKIEGIELMSEAALKAVKAA